jgi:hypothetical protein
MVTVLNKVFLPFSQVLERFFSLTLLPHRDTGRGRDKRKQVSHSPGFPPGCLWTCLAPGSGGCCGDQGENGVWDPRMTEAGQE